MEEKSQVLKKNTVIFLIKIIKTIELKNSKYVKSEYVDMLWHLISVYPGHSLTPNHRCNTNQIQEFSNANLTSILIRVIANHTKSRNKNWGKHRTLKEIKSHEKANSSYLYGHKAIWFINNFCSKDIYQPHDLNIKFNIKSLKLDSYVKRT